MDAQNNQTLLLKVSDLEKFGISSKIVISQYQKKNIRELNLDELIKVSPNEESKNIKFETFDKISVVVPVDIAAGAWNKIE